MTIKEIQEKIITEFSRFKEPMDRYEHIVELGQYLPGIQEKYKTTESLVKGCQSRVWLHAELKDGKIFYIADSDTVITKGIIALLTRVLSDRTPKEIAESNLFFIDQIGVKKFLAPTRNNGLTEMVRRMKMYATAFQTQ